MVSIGSFILKATSFCNLNCSYCYMFNLEDRSYLRRPKTMPLDLINISAQRVTEHALENSRQDAVIIIHGGEPLLAGRNWVRAVVEAFRAAGAGKVNYRFGVQTNGVLLDAAWIDLFRELRVRVSLSMDGPRHIHDRSRVNHAGRGSYEDVVRGLRLVLGAPDADRLFGGLLCVVNPSDEGLVIYRHFRDLGVRRIDFLLPLEYNWDNPPPGYRDPAATPFADYLVPIFDDWWSEDNPDIEIRIFYVVLNLLLGGKFSTDALGGRPVNIAVIESDGSLEPVDSLRACGDGFTQLGLNVRRDPISALYERSLFRAAMAGQTGLSAVCQACPIHETCGGGYLPNRYSRARGFDNPSVYCRDLWKLITHIEATVRERIQQSQAVSSM